VNLIDINYVKNQTALCQKYQAYKNFKADDMDDEILLKLSESMIKIDDG
jgi:hypothetical protein